MTLALSNPGFCIASHILNTLSVSGTGWLFRYIAYHYCRIKSFILNCFKILTILILYF